MQEKLGVFIIGLSGVVLFPQTDKQNNDNYFNSGL